MKKILTGFLFMLCVVSYSQSVADTINEEDVKRHINYLASDKLKGRVNFTKEQLEAADYLSKEFASYGLVPFSGYTNFYHPFMSFPGKIIHATKAKEKLADSVLYNIIGMLPGKSRSDEIIIFSAHYDHVRDGPFSEIFNGANDNASGTAAVLMLARYFSMRQDNERTLVFCLFAGEEMGLIGSADFAKRVEPDKIKAVINIEMIGRTNRTGKNGFFVTGSEYSDLADILKKNLKGEKVKVRNEGSDVTGLYYRSDNYSFAKKGIPAHSIMCSDDKEDCYHKPCDDAKWIDTENMTRVIKAIAKGSATLISGEDTPWRTSDMSGVKSLEAFFSGIPIFKGFDTCKKYIATNPLLGIDSINNRGIYSSFKPGVANRFPFPDSMEVKILLSDNRLKSLMAQQIDDKSKGIVIEGVFGNDIKSDKASTDVFKLLKNALTSHYSKRIGDGYFLHFSKGENKDFPECWLSKVNSEDGKHYYVLLEYWGM